MKNSTKRQHNYQGDAGVYLVIAPQWSDNLCKVGMSSNLNERVKNYCYSNCPNILEKKYFCENHTDMEKILLKAFSNHHELKLKCGKETFEGDVEIMIELFDRLTCDKTIKKDEPESDSEPEPSPEPSPEQVFRTYFLNKNSDICTEKVQINDLRNEKVLNVFKTLEKNNKDFKYITTGWNYNNYDEKLPCDDKIFNEYFEPNRLPWNGDWLEAIGYAYRIQKWWKRVKN